MTLQATERTTFAASRPASGTLHAWPRRPDTVEKGYRLDIRRPALGDDLPQTLERHAGAIIFGGPMSANDPHDYVKAEIDWLKVPLKENKPFLGICLGAQMLSKHLGGKVEADRDGKVEIGWYPLHATEHGRLFDAALAEDGLSFPQGRVRTAARRRASGFRRDLSQPGLSLRKNAWGLQFHAELTRAMMHSWVVRGAQRFGMPNAQVGSQHLEGRMLFDTPLRAWLGNFLDLVFEGKPQR